MCQTTLISQNIVRLGTRSYKYRLETLASSEYRVRSLHKLNHDLDTFYDFLYAQCNSVTETDYKIFGEQFNSMLATLKLLWQTCKRIPKSSGLGNEVEKLRINYSALYELNEDIKYYRIKALKNADCSALLSQASIALKKIAYD